MGSSSRWVFFLGLMIALTAVAGAETESATDAAAQQVDRNRYLEAAAAAQRGDYVVAYCIWHPLAEQGDADAEYALGWMYHNGYGLVSDDRAAKAWWEKAIAQGHTDAMFALGTLYSVGSDTIDRDYSAAMRMWLQAAAARHENARFALRELLQRNLPEVASLARSLRAQYPQLLGMPLPEPHRGAKARQELASAQDSQNGFAYRGELIAVAAGYRPEYGWAAVRLLKEAEQMTAELRQ